MGFRLTRQFYDDQDLGLKRRNLKRVNYCYVVIKCELGIRLGPWGCEAQKYHQEGKGSFGPKTWGQLGYSGPIVFELGLI